MRHGATPTTSQINAHDFEEEFTKYIKNGDSIIYISISSSLDALIINSANIARNNLMKNLQKQKLN